MSAELLVARKMVAFGQQVDVELAEDRGETVGIVEFGLDCATRYAQPVAKRFSPMPVADSTTAICCAAGSIARTQIPPSLLCIPRNAKGLSWRAPTMAST